ncbi:hypothetical protein FOCC_FOCC013431, partial [Frankliniella occidentalis]
MESPVSNIVQGKLWKETILPKFEEPDNVIGSHCGDHKLGTLYYNCPVIPKEFISALKNIFVAALRTKILRNWGDRNKCKWDFDTIVFCLDSYIGDILGLHSILGFAEGFTATYPCRICQIHKTLLHRCIRVPPHLLRTVQNYEEDVQTNNMRLNGVFETCVFNSVDSHQVVVNKSIDRQHDVLKGVA